jgi:hypothetical protein
MLLWEILTNHGNQIDIGEKTGGRGKIGGGAPQQVIHLAKRSLH